MKHICILITISLSFLTSCGKVSEKVCNVSDPLSELTWLKQMKDIFDFDMSGQRQSINLFIYNNQHVFKISNCEGCADEMTIVYNCEGKKICEFGGIAGINTCPDFESNATFIKTLYDQ